MIMNKCEHCKYKDQPKYRECPDFAPKTDNPDSANIEKEK